MTSQQTTATDVASYMYDRLVQKKAIYQEMIVYDIHRIFGDTVTYQNANGNLAIGKDVLKEFRKLTGDDYVWDRGERMWRKRQSWDKAGRSQD